MKQLSVYNFFFIVFLTGTNSYAQKQTKTFLEKYNVVENAVININTTHTDIEFETWDKNEVSVEVVIEIEGVDAKDMDAYFKQNEVKVLGNSKQIDIATGVENTWFFKHATGGFNSKLDAQNLNLAQLATTVNGLENLSFMMDSIRFPDFPNSKAPEFDFKAFEKEGDTYLKKWQKNFDANFSKKDQEAFTKMTLEFEAQRKLFSKDQEDFHEEAMAFEKRRIAFEKRRNKLEQEREENLAVRKQDYEQLKSDLQERRAELKVRLKDNSELRFAKRNDTIYFDSLMLQKRSPNVYYFNSTTNGNSGKVKVKKYLKIKMPKSVILKMNVRHGEVKLAENTKNMNGTFSYAGLYAKTIDGDKTQIDASYSPINIQNWNYGKLKVNYSDEVAIKEVGNLTLSAVSSEVTIDKLMQKIFAENSFGTLQIQSVSPTFSSIDITVKNATLLCKLPKAPFTITVNGENSAVLYPNQLQIEKTKNVATTFYKGFYLSKNPDKTIHINSKFSEIVLD